MATRASLLLCLFLTGCYFHSREPFVLPNNGFPFEADMLRFEERVLDKGVWSNPRSHRLRRIGPSTFRGEPDEGVGGIRLNQGLNREIRFERLRPGFFAAMWKHDGDISGVPNGYFYDLVYVDSARKHVYHWSLEHLLRLGDQPTQRFYEFCAARYGGPPTTRPGITVTFGDRETLLRVMRGCIDEIVSRRIPPDSRYRWM